MEDHSFCIHLLEVGDERICMIEHNKPVHSYGEIARILGISKQAVMTLEKKALDKMKSRISAALRKEGLNENDLFRTD